MKVIGSWAMLSAFVFVNYFVSFGFGSNSPNQVCDLCISNIAYVLAPDASVADYLFELERASGLESLKSCPDNIVPLSEQQDDFGKYNPSSVARWLLRAKLTACVDEDTKAVRALTFVEMMMPNRSDMLLKTAGIWESLGKSENALKSIQAAVVANPKIIHNIQERVVALSSDQEAIAEILNPMPLPRSVPNRYLPEANMKFALESGNIVLADEIWDRAALYQEPIGYYFRKYISLVEEQGELDRVRVVSEFLGAGSLSYSSVTNGGFENEFDSGLFGWNSTKSDAFTVERFKITDLQKKTVVRVTSHGESDVAFRHLDQVIMVSEPGRYEVFGEWRGSIKENSSYWFFDVLSLKTNRTEATEKKSGVWPWEEFRVSFSTRIPFERIKLRLRSTISARESRESQSGAILIDNVQLRPIN